MYRANSWKEPHVVKRFLLACALAGVLVMPVASASAGRGHTAPDENGCIVLYSGFNRAGTFLCSQ